MGSSANPSDGGNKDEIGWKLIGFEDQSYYAPPFGYYDAQPGGEGMSAASLRKARYPLNEAVDFLIVGCGASGSVLARELSRNGFSVVALEQGPWLDRSHFTSRRISRTGAVSAD